MDKRIKKTRRNLKNALTELLQEKAFEKITVTEICERADTSRITFYTHYSDKYDLLENLFNDREAMMVDYFAELQKTTNPDDNPLLSYQNLLDAFLEAFYNQFNFFHSAPMQNNLDLMFLYYRFVTTHIEEFEVQYAQKMESKYPRKQLSAFLALGIFGFIHQADEAHVPVEQIQKDALELMGDIVNSDIFVKK